MSENTTARAERLTLVLTGALALVTAGLMTFVPNGALVPLSVPGWATAVALVLGFVLAEQLAVRIEFRRQTHTITLSVIPLIIGAVVAPIAIVVAARFVGAGAAFALCRMRLGKLGYNIAAYAAEAAIVTTLIHAVLEHHSGFGVVTTALLLAVVMLVDQVMSLLVLLVIRLHTGPLGRRRITEESSYLFQI